MLIGHALKHAKANLEKARPGYVAALHAKIEHLRKLPRADAAELYRLAREVGSDSGALGFSHISQAALSLCDLLVSGAPEGRMRASIEVHIDAIQALRAPAEAGAKAESDAILNGLFALSGRTP